ncbi:conserved hypothetical protein [Gloeothece citriformis PCC 7424]|uniref:DUF4278 domain-containing protein n=1 Tax=Gloeothece citriformis (strain PCC 7424) TaxID=65393 RepID=B7KF18_GLOC7|nr:DUF4278 domain-containing protein [Gloeothece citriformis]ACK70474.1 conserved hypothetical protein [Gloeothece citriformis PCC 7424]
MKLTYRGISYNYNPVTVETSEGTTGGKYRGLDWRFRNLKKSPILQPRVNLTYRGVTYNKGGTEVAELPQVTEVTPKLSTQDKARTLMVHHTRVIKKRQQAMLSRVATEVGLPETAAKYWNRIQGKVHPTFRHNYDRFGATLS